jgi:hypothetical protein
MSKYYCECCKYNARVKSSFDKHLKSKKHELSSQSHHFVTPKSPFCHLFDTILPKASPPPFQCHYCHKNFKHRQGMYRHIKYTCKKNKDEDLKELARLLNEKDHQIATIQSSMKKQIDKLTQKLQIQNVVHGDVNNTVYNIQLLNHSETDYSHLTPIDYMQCIKKCNNCVKNLIERVHFNDKKPENMNIFISNIKGIYAMVYKEDKWQIVNKKEQIDELYDCNEVLLESWYDEYNEQYPEIIKSFQRYLKNRDESNIINHVKEEILIMLYNNREMIAE